MRQVWQKVKTMKINCVSLSINSNEKDFNKVRNSKNLYTRIPLLTFNANYNKEFSQKTQNFLTTHTYAKLREHFCRKFENYTELDKLDFGAGLGLGAKILGAESLEPFAKKWKPNYIKPEEIHKKYDLITCLFVLNVIGNKAERDNTVRKIGNLLKNNGEAYFITRYKKEVDRSIKIKKNYSDGFLTSIGTFQKGYTQREFREYISYLLGKGFETSDFSGIKSDTIMVKVKKLKQE